MFGLVILFSISFTCVGSGNRRCWWNHRRNRKSKYSFREHSAAKTRSSHRISGGGVQHRHRRVDHHARCRVLQRLRHHDRGILCNPGLFPHLVSGGDTCLRAVGDHPHLHRQRRLRRLRRCARHERHLQHLLIRCDQAQGGQWLASPRHQTRTPAWDCSKDSEKQFNF